MVITSRSQALRDGDVRYFTGKPCKRGHIAPRTTSNKTCTKCQCARVAEWQKRNLDKAGPWRRDAQRRFKEKRPNRLKEIKAKYREGNRDKLRVEGEAYYARNRERSAKRKRRWRDQYPWLHAEHQRTRQLRKQRATPTWVDRAEIQEKYKEAHELTLATGIKHSVDHIYPIAGKNSCGLHVPWNLQVIPLIDNIRKRDLSPEEFGRRQSDPATTSWARGWLVALQRAAN